MNDSTVPGLPAEPEASPARLVLTLTLAGLLAGLILAVAYRQTLPVIQANQARALREAVFQVLPGATSMRGLVLEGSTLRAAGEGATPDLFAGYSPDGLLVGYAVPGEGPGFQDTIRLLYGYDPSRQKIVGMQVLDSRETPGLGDKIFKDPAFRKAFLDLDFREPLVLVKAQAAPGGHEVDAITGATISSKAVVRIINDTRSRFPSGLPAATAAPPPPAGASPEALPPGGPVGAPRAGSEVKGGSP